MTRKRTLPFCLFVQGRDSSGTRTSLLPPFASTLCLLCAIEGTLPSPSLSHSLALALLSLASAGMLFACIIVAQSAQCTLCLLCAIEAYND